ncbi:MULTISPECIES: hypothetical protein [unclassified Clostridium]|jgi:hypothetical protein|uniref:hypothetical protein n=1 Tax=unclassified Clostridium TaxID=2614128 RepID=UPI0025C31A27|nr:hypothetical protein [Clostridium sp.]MCI6692099.1 hypothetical protein [Clostridium sp.]MDY2629888.1 hypothetical protein [Clostridium sp.]MDY4252618.1 hypothetical protein [Clostridium sp.]MDY6227711.1 hypothetical protein [Clostridium sp.]
METYAITFYLNEDSHTCGCEEHDHDHEHHHHHRDDYDIVGTIKSLGAWANFMPDSYLVKTTSSAKEIAEKIQAFLETGDLLFVTKVDKENVASLTPGVVDWINS